LVKVRQAGPTLTQSRRFIYVEVTVFGSAQDGQILGVEDGPHSRWTMMTTTTPRAAASPSAAAKTMSSLEHGRVWPGTKDCRSRSESSGGPTRYKQCWNLLLHRLAARDDAACKSYALRPVLRPCLAVGRRQCHSPKAGDGELQKAAPESSFLGPSGNRCPRHINDCKTSKRSRPRSPVCVDKRLNM
jgi:hypothetical protein